METRMERMEVRMVVGKLKDKLRQVVPHSRQNEYVLNMVNQ